MGEDSTALQGSLGARYSLNVEMEGALVLGPWKVVMEGWDPTVVGLECLTRSTPCFLTR